MTEDNPRLPLSRLPEFAAANLDALEKNSRENEIAGGIIHYNIITHRDGTFTPIRCVTPPARAVTVPPWLYPGARIDGPFTVRVEVVEIDNLVCRLSMHEGSWWARTELIVKHWTPTLTTYEVGEA